MYAEGDMKGEWEEDINKLIIECMPGQASDISLLYTDSFESFLTYRAPVEPIMHCKEMERQVLFTFYLSILTQYISYTLLNACRGKCR
jgi:hypothetical protein